MNTAVILSARKEYDSEIPYPLLPINEEGDMCILDRTISVVRDAGISKIVLVVGYKKELFEKYRSEGIIIVVNPEYTFTSSMASLALAEDYVDDDFLLIESDVICERTVIEQLVSTTKSNCFTVVSESGSGDEAMVEVDEGFISKISKDMHQLNKIDGEMIGISKISLETFKRMLLKWRNNKNPKLNYEYLFLDCTDMHQRPFIKPKDLIWQDVDNQKDYHKLLDKTYRRLKRKEDPFDRQNILSHLRGIFPDETIGDNVTVEFIGGMTNRNFKVAFNDKVFVMRIPGNGTEGMVDRKNEEVNSVLGCTLGITPAIPYYNKLTGIKLTEYIIDAETLNNATIKRADNLNVVIDILKSLHNSGTRQNNEFNVFHEIEKYESLMRAQGACMYDGWEKVHDVVMGLESMLNKLGISLKPCHNDLVPENFIKDRDGKIYLIDWEYSGINDPLSDLAALFLESDFNDDDKEYALTRYFDGNVPENTSLKITIYQILLDYLWSVWTVIKEAKGDDFGSYGKGRYDRAISNLNKLNLL